MALEVSSSEGGGGELEERHGTGVRAHVPELHQGLLREAEGQELPVARRSDRGDLREDGSLPRLSPERRGVEVSSVIPQHALTRQYTASEPGQSLDWLSGPAMTDDSRQLSEVSHLRQGLVG